MSNRNIYRENQKNRLKRQIVGEAAQNAPEYDYGSRFPARKVLPAAAIVLFLLFAVGWFYLTNRHYESLDVLWENQISAESGQTDTFRGYERFAKGIIRYSKDGAAYIDHDGKTVWERSYQMQNPIVSVSGDYAAIADRGAQSIYIFSDSANTGVAATVLPVTRITVSEGGIVYATLRDEEADATGLVNNQSALTVNKDLTLEGNGFAIIAKEGTFTFDSAESGGPGERKGKSGSPDSGENGPEAENDNRCGHFRSHSHSGGSADGFRYLRV